MQIKMNNHNNCCRIPNPYLAPATSSHYNCHHCRCHISSSSSSSTSTSRMSRQRMTTSIFLGCWVLIVTIITNSGMVRCKPLVKSSSSQFCQSDTNVNQVYNIGSDIYLALSSKSIHRFDVQQRKFYPDKFEINQLFGQNKLKWVDTVINLNGICNAGIVNLCDQQSVDGTSMDPLERIHVVIGNRLLSTGERYYGMALYEYLGDDVDQQQLRLLTSLEQPLLERLNRTGINVNLQEQEGSIMMGSFWPSLYGNLYYRSGLFVPSKSDIFFSIYDNNVSGATQRLIHRRLAEQEWNNLNEQLGHGRFLIGMFNFSPKDRTFGLTKDNQVVEFLWDEDGNIKFITLGPIREFLNCYGNSTELEKDSTTLIPSKTTTTTPTTSISTTIKSETTHFITRPPLPKVPEGPKTIDHVSDKDDDNDNDIDDDDDDNEHSEIKENNDINKDEEIPIPAENESNVNDIDHQRDDPSIHDSSLLSSSSVAPHMAEASIRNPFKHQDNSLIWSLGILAGVMILVAIIILIPILIIRHRSRKNQLNLTKQTNGKKQSALKKKKNGTKMNGLDQSNCSEEVQLMNCQTDKTT